MRLYRVMVILLVLSAAGIWNLNAAADDSEAVKLVTTGRIDKIDAKHRTFQFKFNLDQPQFGRGAARPSPGGRPGGIGGRRGRIGGYPGRDRYPNQAIDNSMEVKVYVSEATRVKGPASAFQFSDLRTGDRVTITATHRGHGDDLDAQVVARN